MAGQVVEVGVEPGLLALGRELRGLIRGEVRVDPGARALYATDASNYRHLPIAVVTPRDDRDVEAVLGVCRARHLPVLPRGGGTSLAGQCCNTAVVIDFSRHMHHIIEIDAQAGAATVEPGVVLDDLRAAAERVGLTFGPDPATHSRCTLGGMVGNNSCGVHSVMAGKTVDNVEALEIVTGDGVRMWVGATGPDQLASLTGSGGRTAEIYAALSALSERLGDRIRAAYPDIPRRVSGYNLDQLLRESGCQVARALVGTEGTCVTVLKARLRLVASPGVRRTVVIGFADGPAAADAVPAVMEHHPIGVEGFDSVLMDDVRALGLHRAGWSVLPDGGGWLLVELGSARGESAADVEARAQRLADDFEGAKVLSEQESPPVWGIRESGLGAAARVPGRAPTWAGWEDSAVDPARLGDYLRALRELYDRYGYHAALYGHFGQGCVHSRVDFDLSSATGIARFHDFLGEAADLCVQHGGSLSGEHGDGQARAELLPRMFGQELVAAFEEFKAIWDPASLMNPGKVVRPRRAVDDLRLGADYRPRPLSTTFAFADDGGDFGKAVSRCVGVGACRSHSGGVMCPSYRATREEEHSTRGRAHLLFELLNGTELADGWADPHVKEALDLCLSCKGCKGECPVHVDMARYKAEFLSHWFGWRPGHLRPRPAYSMGLIMYAARLGSAMPTLANLVTQTPGLSAIAKATAGVHHARQVPAFTATTFRAAWRYRPPNDRRVPAGRGDPVVLWPDTFTDHFRPAAGVAAVRVLESAGCEVRLPDRWVCCGRPLYDWGMLGRATALLRRTLEVIGPQIDAGLPIVVLEPSCASVFREELPDLLPRDQRARRLAAQTVTLAEYLRDQRPGWKVPAVEGPVLAHGHCHDKSVLDFDAERELLQRTGARISLPDEGCCGMAGAFGFEAEHHDLAQTIGEAALLPAVRAADPATAIVADGFSCHEQIRQNTGRTPVHLAQLLAAVLPAGSPRPSDRRAWR